VSANASAVVRYVGDFQEMTRRSFLRALERLQGIPLNRHADDDDVFIDFKPAVKDHRALRELMAVADLPEGWAYPPREQLATRRRVEEALDVLAAVNPSAREAMRLVVGSLLMARLPGYEAGSRTNVIGGIWLGLPPERPALDFAELILHEFVHQCVFLEDMVHGIFFAGERELSEPPALVTSAIRRTRRGYDKAFHSAIVAATMLHFRAQTSGAPLEDLLDPLRLTVAELVEKPQFLTGHGRETLAELAVLVS